MRGASLLSLRGLIPFVISSSTSDIFLVPRIAEYFNIRPAAYTVPALEPQPIATASRSSLAAAHHRFSCASLADCCWPCAALTFRHVRRIEEAPSSRPGKQKPVLALEFALRSSGRTRLC